MRLFFALELNDLARRELDSLQRRLLRNHANVQWVKPENLHLTLKFLGEVEENRLPELRQAAEEAAASFSPFLISLEGVGAFPGARHPRVIWVDIQEGRETVVRLARALEEACGRLGFPPEERPFSAHITLGRTRALDSLSAPAFKSNEPIRVDRLVLFQSKLSPHGSGLHPRGRYSIFS